MFRDVHLKYAFLRAFGSLAIIGEEVGKCFLALWVIRKSRKEMSVNKKGENEISAEDFEMLEFQLPFYIAWRRFSNALLIASERGSNSHLATCFRIFACWKCVKALPKKKYFKLDWWAS